MTPARFRFAAVAAAFSTMLAAGACACSPTHLVSFGPAEANEADDAGLPDEGGVSIVKDVGVVPEVKPYPFPVRLAIGGDAVFAHANAIGGGFFRFDLPASNPTKLADDPEGGTSVTSIASDERSLYAILQTSVPNAPQELVTIARSGGVTKRTPLQGVAPMGDLVVTGGAAFFAARSGGATGAGLWQLYRSDLATLELRAIAPLGGEPAMTILAKSGSRVLLWRPGMDAIGTQDVLVVESSGAVRKVAALPAGGLDGQIVDLAADGDDIFVIRGALDASKTTELERVSMTSGQRVVLGPLPRESLRLTVDARRIYVLDRPQKAASHVRVLAFPRAANGAVAIEHYLFDEIVELSTFAPQLWSDDRSLFVVNNRAIVRLAKPL